MTKQQILEAAYDALNGVVKGDTLRAKNALINLVNELEREKRESGND